MENKNGFLPLGIAVAVNMSGLTTQKNSNNSFGTVETLDEQ
jgi:hypothetical protein